MNLQIEFDIINEPMYSSEIHLCLAHKSYLEIEYQTHLLFEIAKVKIDMNGVVDQRVQKI